MCQFENMNEMLIESYKFFVAVNCICTIFNFFFAQRANAIRPYK